jgi:hypothetical protein
MLIYKKLILAITNHISRIPWRFTFASLLLVVASLVLICFLSFYDSIRGNSAVPLSEDKIPFGILGDSDSHSYQDTIRFSDPALRGGVYRPTTFQWGEVLFRLRSHETDPGEWGTWGSRAKIAALASAFGLEGRLPKKRDFRYNFAVSGSGCSDLLEGSQSQTQRLLYLMRKEPLRWQNGVIVIRIGVNSFAHTRHLDELATNGFTIASRASVMKCVDYIQRSVREIRMDFPTTRIVLVGIFDNSNWAPNLAKWQSPHQLATIREALDLFDNELRTIVQHNSYMAFFDDRAWFLKYWGGRDRMGHPAYRTVSLSGGFPVTNSQGDHPKNAVVADGHAGTIWNGLWARSLVELINQKFGMNITPINEAEISRLIESETH